ncbi:hypothetical protein UA08_06851 [Talaromyces atroroseus]|uniref:Zn(2)-C6 fungal-type domain-containing protein n=1 Tax=Talaromyces atroroseus TaxID=1441469 RepID=A0A225AV11_TALAT|nr:hypothetical protein UA08_06851 [Talaromyces atroroseus]OKL58275.1 hypothetical protein UA08_06851 [Talaromyces atroroseus]
MSDSPREDIHSPRQQQSAPNTELNAGTAGVPTRRETLTPSSSSRAPEAKASGEKVWIPRASTRIRPFTRIRTKHACEACRRRRIKCDGGRPVCQGCAATGTECVYSDHKRARDTQEMKSLKSTVDKYEHLLRDLLHEVPSSAAKRIKLNLTPAVSSSQSRHPSVSSSSTSSAGSVTGIDTIGEDLNRDEQSRATGFMGKNSVLAWLRNLESDSGFRASTEQSMEMMGGLQVNRAHSSHFDGSKASYFLDDKQLPTSRFVDSLTLPRRQLADWILTSYFTSVHTFFPIVRENLFREQYRNLWGAVSPRPGRKWLAIFNMILAIGCRQLGFQGPLPIDVKDEIFFSRARTLSVNENMAFEHADLQQVQVEALVGLYFVVSTQINREARSRLWWSIYVLENLLSHMTGRPTCIGSAAFSVEPPMPFNEDMFEHPKAVELLTDEPLRRRCLKWSLDEQDSKDELQHSWLHEIEPNQGLQFYYLVDLIHIVDIAIGELFSPTGFQASRSYIKRRIQFYDQRIDFWLSGLHPSFRFTDEHCNPALQNLSQEQTVLALHHYSARIVLYRPCSPFRKYDSSKEKEYHYISQRCLHSALSLIFIFPETVSLDWVYNLSPWWCILHFLMQASTILIIFCQSGDELYSERQNCLENGYIGEINSNQIINACRKAHSWLHALSNVDESCRRAFLLYDGLTRRIGLDVTPPSTSTPHKMSSGYEYGMPISNAEFNQQPYMQGWSPQHAAMASDAYTTRRDFPIPGDPRHSDTVSSINLGSTNTPGPLDAIESEDMGDNIIGMTTDLMTDNYTQWIRAALDQDSLMNLA